MVWSFKELSLIMLGSASTIDAEGLEAATRALSEQLGAEAREQYAYLHRFDDGKVSMELEWVDPASLARAAVVAYLAAIRQQQAKQ
jgi:hypothetical protein